MLEKKHQITHTHTDVLALEEAMDQAQEELSSE
jgi:hypothetical protein